MLGVLRAFFSPYSLQLLEKEKFRSTASSLKPLRPGVCQNSREVIQFTCCIFFSPRSTVCSDVLSSNIYVFLQRKEKQSQEMDNIKAIHSLMS